MTEVVLGSPTVTIFAEHGPLVDDIADEIRARGAATHTVSVEAGWLASTTRALMMLDSRAGVSAVNELCDSGVSGVHVVALVSDTSRDQMAEVCDTCAERNDFQVMHVDDDDVAARAAEEVVGPHRS